LKTFPVEKRKTILDDDQILIKKIRKGSKAAFEELMRKYNRKIFNFVIRMVRNDEVAVELTQDFFIKIYTVIDKYNFEYKFSTWAYRICYNLVIDHIRKNQMQTESLDSDAVSQKEIVSSENYVKDDGFRILSNEEVKNQLWKLVDGIPLKFKEVILLRYIQELKYEEIADMTGLPVGTVKNRIFKAKEILKQEIEKDGMLA
jgi:RNA polymerase sigma-70 factor (ECF subfamily)